MVQTNLPKSIIKNDENNIEKDLKSRNEPHEYPEAQSLPPKSQEQNFFPTMKPLPIIAPFSDVYNVEKQELHYYWPISRTNMAYSWRYLRRPVADGQADILDIPTTVKQFSELGYFYQPVYKKRERNHAHLILFIDQDGSMIPFHRFTRNLAETALFESTIAQVDIFYFHNFPAEYVYLNSAMTSKIHLKAVFESCTTETGVLIISDAGAARGARVSKRIRETTRFLSALKRHTINYAWLNPMPQPRWSSTSAAIIAHLIPMFQMDPDGLSNAIDIIRGQPLHHNK